MAALKPPAARWGLSVNIRASRLALALSLTAVLAFVLMITLPFAGQPIHIDDAIFWDFARNNLEHPLQQHLENYRLMGQEFTVWRDTHPPLDQMFIAAVMALTGSEAEPALHIGFILFPLIAGISMFFLAQRFTRNALLAVLLLLATPAVMTMSHTLMGDLPMTALWLAATAAYIYGIDRRDCRLLAVAGIFALLAVLSGYQAVLLIGLLPLYSLLTGKISARTVWFSLRKAWPVVLPLLGFGVYCLFSIWHYGSLPRFQHANGLSMEHSRLFERFQGILLQAGGASVFPLVLIAVFALKKRRLAALPFIAAAATVIGYGQSSAHYPLSSIILFTTFLTAGGMMLYAVAEDTIIDLLKFLRRREADRDYIFLGVWMLSVMAVAVILLPHTTAKYMLPFLAPMVLILFKELERVVSLRQVKWIAVAAFALTFITATFVSAADYNLASSSRDFATEFAERHDTGGDVWFVGEWGFRHYMEAQGYRYLSSTDESPRDGDIVVRAEFSDWPLAGRLRDRMHLVETTKTDWEVPLRVMNFNAGAGFYGTYWGGLPYAISSEPVEKFEVYRVGQATT